MIIKKKVIPTGLEGPVNPDMLEDYYEQLPDYLDEKATQGLVTALKAYVDQELGGNA